MTAVAGIVGVKIEHRLKFNCEEFYLLSNYVSHNILTGKTRIKA